jgi:hypothetical protein
VPRERRPARPSDQPDAYGAYSAAIERVRRGEQVLALLEPDAQDKDPIAFTEWLRARLTIAQLPRLLLPRCDDRCEVERHDPDRFVVLADIALDVTEPRRPSWWHGWNDTLERTYGSRPLWYAGAPAFPATPEERRLRAGTSLVRVAMTDPFWVHYDAVTQETMFRVAGGPRQGDSIIAVTFGPSPLLPALSGILIAPDHPPARDPMVAPRLLAAGWAAVERGLPHEE